jgi:hypothetical protein
MDLRYNYHQPIIPIISLNQTNIEWSARLFSNSHVQDTSFTIVLPNALNNTLSERAVLSASDETTPSYQIKGILSSFTPYLSPVVDISQTGASLVSNIINNDATNETNPGGGNSLTRYLTRQTTLVANQDAEDLNVYLTVYRPASTEVRVYAKLMNFEDSDPFDTHDWIEMTPTASLPVSDKSNTTDYKEIEYVLPDDVLTGSNGEYQYVNSADVTFTSYRTFALKIVCLAVDNSIVPFPHNIRAVCLQK